MDESNDIKEKCESSSNNRLQSMLKTLTKCKAEFTSEVDECKKLKEINLKLEIDLKDARELEKSHRYHLQTSREMIGNLQDTVSQLVYLKRDVKKLKDEILSKDASIASLEKDKENTHVIYKGRIGELRKAHENHIEELIAMNENKLQQTRYDSETKIAQFKCVIEEQRCKLKEMEKEHMDKMNVVVLEYEEKIQKSAVEVAQLQEQITMQAARTDANIDAYRRKLEDLEEKLKQSKFKEYLAQSNYPLQSSHSQFENRVERPYSAQRDYIQSNDFNSIPVCSSPSPKPTQLPNMYVNRNFKTPKLEVMSTDNKTQNSAKNEKKGLFTITKKRKLYTAKDFLN